MYHVNKKQKKRENLPDLIILAIHKTTEQTVAASPTPDTSQQRTNHETSTRVNDSLKGRRVSKESSIGLVSIAYKRI